MSRYIDADAYCADMRDFQNKISKICEIIVEQNTVDAVKVVRCKYCKYWNGETKGCVRNPCVEPWQKNDFCSYGER